MITIPYSQILCDIMWNILFPSMSLHPWPLDTGQGIGVHYTNQASPSVHRSTLGSQQTDYPLVRGGVEVPGEQRFPGIPGNLLNDSKWVWNGMNALKFHIIYVSKKVFPGWFGVSCTPKKEGFAQGQGSKDMLTLVIHSFVPINQIRIPILCVS